MLKLFARLIALSLARSQYAGEKLGANVHLQIRIFLERLENLSGLIINFLRHERFTNAELRLNGVRRAIVPVGDRGILHTRHIVALALIIAFGQQQLEPRLGVFTLLLAFGLLGISKLNEPATQNIFHIRELFLAPTGHQVLAHKLNQIRR